MIALDKEQRPVGVFTCWGSKVSDTQALARVENYAALDTVKDWPGFFQGRMPCGHEFSYSLNELPEQSTRCPGDGKCGAKSCWIVRYRDG